MVSRLNVISKNNKTSLLNDNITIDAKHSEMIHYFKNLQDSIPSLKDELKKLISDYNNKDNNRKNDIEYILYKDNLKDKINEIKNKINSILNNEELNKYYLDVGILLHGYYENIENSKNIKNNSENFEENLLNYNNLDDVYDISNDVLSDDDYQNDSDNEDFKLNCNDKKTNYKSVINFFKTRETKEIDELDEQIENIDNSKNESGIYTSMKISDFVKEESTFKKKNVLDEYLQKIDPNYISKIKIDVNICKCPLCNTEMTLYPSDGIQICENCGNQQNILIESDKPSFKDPPMEVCYFSYKRINHYNELEPLSTTKLIIIFLKNFKKMIFNLLRF
jgi:hypothetical protein